MKIKFTFILLIFSLLAFSQDYPKKKVGGKECYVYTVQAGDGMLAIARKFSVTKAEIAAVNPNISENLKVGQTLYIPVKNSAQPPVNKQDNSKKVIEHKVEAQQTFFSICKMYDVTQEEVLALNKDLNIEKISIGQVIKIPAKKQQEQDKNAPVAATEKKETKPQPQQQPQKQTQQQPQPKTAPKGNFISYEIKKNKETLYSISKEFGVSINEILEANPEAENGIQKGDILQIPVAEKVAAAQPETPKNEPKKSTETLHVVQPKETVYGISKIYNVPQDDLYAANPEIKDGLKVGQTLIIPQGTQPKEIAAVETPKPQAEQKIEPIAAEPTKKSLKIAFLLPFTNTDNQNVNVERFMNFYRGALLALEEAKKLGISVDVQTFDTGLGTGSLNRILAEKSLASIDLIIGPAYPEQVTTVAAFAKKNKIAQVVPFSSKIDKADRHEYLYQFNPVNEDIVHTVTEDFAEKFANHNIVFVNFSEKNDKGAKFADTLKKNLRAKSIKFTEISNHDLIETSLKGKKNIVVFATNNHEDVANLMSEIKNLNSGVEFWATDEIKENLPELKKCYSYSMFNDNVTEKYLQQYQKWFGTRVCNTTPCYDLLGYDIVYYFLNANYNSSTSTFSGKSSVRVLQSVFNFLPQKIGKGYLNYGYFLNCKSCE